MSDVEPVVAADGLIKRHGDHDILRGVTLSVRRGEVAAIVGPSGGGKSTFLRCINGLEDFQGGTLTVLGRTLTADQPTRERQADLLAIRRRVGMVFQQFNLFPHLTVVGNVMEAPVQVLGTPKAAAREQALALIDRVGLKDKAESRTESLSGGQQQRVAIARALAMAPELMLFDEPTSALDPRLVGEVMAVMLDLARSGQTMLVVTHDLDFARKAATTVHVFELGVVARSGPPSAVLQDD